MYQVVVLGALAGGAVIGSKIAEEWEYTAIFARFVRLCASCWSPGAVQLALPDCTAEGDK